MLLQDAFNDPAFSVAELTTFINKRPYKPGLVSQLALFREYGTMTVDIQIEEANGVLEALPFTPRGGERTVHNLEKGTLRKLSIPHIGVEGKIWADELLRARAPGELRKWQLREMVDEMIARLTDRIDVTQEIHRVNALLGLVKDPISGATKYNMFTEFGVSQETETALDLTSTTAGQLTRKINTITRRMRANAGNLMLGPIVGLCSGSAWDDLVVNPEVVASYTFDSSAEFLRNQIAEGSFRWRGITWIEYDRSVGATSLVPADKIIIFPSQTEGLFESAYAPADFLSPDLADEMRGLPRYVPVPTADPEHPNAPRWVKVEGSTNPLHFCTRPKLLEIAKRGS